MGKGAFDEESVEGAGGNVVVEKKLDARGKAWREYERVVDLISKAELDISRVDDDKEEPIIREMIKNIKHSIPRDAMPRFPGSMDGVDKLVRRTLWNGPVRKGFAALCNLLFVIVDCAGYLNVELFGEKCMGLTKMLQRCFGELG